MYGSWLSIIFKALSRLDLRLKFHGIPSSGSSVVTSNAKPGSISWFFILMISAVTRGGG